MSELFVEVAVPVPMRQLFTYRVPKNLQQPAVNIGERVIVPFGHRKVVAIVIKQNTTTNINTEKLKDISHRIVSEHQFDPMLLQFLSLCASYYQHPVGEVLQLALPVLFRQLEQPQLKPDIGYQSTQELDDTAAKSLATKAKKQHQLFELITKRPHIKWPEIKALGFSKSQLDGLLQKNMIAAIEQTATAFTWHQTMLNSDNKLDLSVEQALIVSAINQLDNQFSCHLVDGVTGSGKTEVYLQVIEHILAANQQVLVLVPEIGLTPQLLSRFEQRFNVPIYLHHSGMNDKERLSTWLAAQKNTAAIIIGTRSAVFSPLSRLGLIIVDEEHDASFKQQDSFRYHGRDLAIIRAKQLQIPIVLGSATPSLESLHNADIGKFHYHKLTKRAGNSQQAKIELVDVSSLYLEHGLSLPVKQAIEKTLAKGEQALVFLNRRGYAPAINCQECHWVAECSRCNKPYTFHANNRLLICHHCSGQKRPPSQCQQCGSVRIAPMGVGTEQLEEKISQQFANYSAIRIDRDSTRAKGALAKLLQEVTNNKHQLLIGTQMLAKGHHFPNVTLVVILDVDGALFSFDFRAAENMAQLLVQVAGRAGRASKPGKVLVQTQYPAHPLLQDLAHNGYRHFASQALLERRQAKLPPFSYQALIRAEANYPSYPAQFLNELSQLPLKQCEFAGPVPAAMEKKAGKFRYHLIIQSSDRKALHMAVLQLVELASQSPMQNKVRWSIDIDPLDLTW